MAILALSARRSAANGFTFVLEVCYEDGESTKDAFMVIERDERMYLVVGTSGVELPINSNGLHIYAELFEKGVRTRAQANAEAADTTVVSSAFRLLHAASETKLVEIVYVGDDMDFAQDVEQGVRLFTNIPYGCDDE